uniref:Uncharacterized protein n=1 Tax=Globodera rostochiensis TaxID=31243 RepID=A0A914GPC5_GLORO
MGSAGGDGLGTGISSVFSWGELLELARRFHLPRGKMLPERTAPKGNLLEAAEEEERERTPPGGQTDASGWLAGYIQYQKV